MMPGSASWWMMPGWLVPAVLAVVLPCSLGGCPINPDSGNDTLAGTWTGDIDYTISATIGSIAGNTMDFTRPFTVTFTADGQPDALVTAIGNDTDIIRIPATGLLKEGDTVEAVSETENPSTGAVTTIRTNATVTSVSRSVVSFEIELDLNITLTGHNTGTLPGTYSLQASLQPDGKLAWTGSLDLVVGDPSLGVSAQVTSVGSLSRQ